MSSELAPPRTGPCTPWIDAADVLGMYFPERITVDESLAAQMATVASNLLYTLSGRKFTGLCGPVKVRPMYRPTDQDTRGLSRVPIGYIAISGYSSVYGQSATGAFARYGTSTAPVVDLGVKPVVDVQQVKIDGEIIPPNEYKLMNDRRTLERIRPYSGATPTARFGFPITQIMDLEDTEPGTFSVTYTYGVAPPAEGVWAAQKLAQLLCIDTLSPGKDGVLPKNVTSVSRQGVTVQTLSLIEFVQKGMTGIWEIDVFLKAVNPSGNTQKPIVFSPDVIPSKRW